MSITSKRRNLQISLSRGTLVILLGAVALAVALGLIFFTAEDPVSQQTEQAPSELPSATFAATTREPTQEASQAPPVVADSSPSTPSHDSTEPEVQAVVTAPVPIPSNGTADEVGDDAKVPLSFLQSADVALTEDEQAELEWMQQKFIADVGQPNGDDEAYRRRWKKARAWQDSHFQTMFGDEAFNALQQEQVIRESEPQ